MPSITVFLLWTSVRKFARCFTTYSFSRPTRKERVGYSWSMGYIPLSRGSSRASDRSGSMRLLRSM